MLERILNWFFLLTHRHELDDEYELTSVGGDLFEGEFCRWR